MAVQKIKIQLNLNVINKLPVGFGRVKEYRQTIFGCLGVKLNSMAS